MGLGVVGPDDRDQAEEDERAEVAQPIVAERQRAVGVGDSPDHREHADREDRPTPDGDQVDPADRGQAQHGNDAAFNAPLADQPRCGHTQRPHPLGRICSLLEVAQVVGKVGGDLEEQRGQERGQAGDRIERTVAHGQCGADDDRRHRGGQGARPGRENPGLPAGDVSRPRGIRGARGVRGARQCVAAQRRSAGHLSVRKRTLCVRIGQRGPSEKYATMLSGSEVPGTALLRNVEVPGT